MFVLVLGRPVRIPRARGLSNSGSNLRGVDAIVTHTNTDFDAFAAMLAARRLYPGPLDPKVRGIIDRMRSQATAQLQLASDTFAERDPAKASALEDMDDVMDDLQKELYRTIFAAGAREEAELQRAVQVALLGRYFERIADHAVNIGERVGYMVTGEFKE